MGAPHGSPCLICCQGGSEWPEGCRRPLRGTRHLGLLHPQQTQVADEACQAHEHQPQEGSIPPPLSRRHVLACDAWHAPHKQYRGSAAFQRIKCVEGIPEPFNSIKRVVVPDALRIQRLRPGRKFSCLGKLASDLGWGYSDVVANYETKRKEKNAEWYGKVKAKRTAFAKAKASTAQ